jgi:hypothetical protein
MRILLPFLRLATPMAIFAFVPALNAATNASVTIQVDAALDHHAISPLIYGVAFATSNQLKDLNVPFNRSGGNSTTRYNWTTNASNHANDWYFESLPDDGGSVPGASVDEFISDSKNGGAQAAITIPIIGWVAKLGPNSQRLSSFATNKYGVQTGNDWQWFPTAGNGVLAKNGQDITNNDPTDANLSVTTNFETGWIQHLTNRWGAAATPNGLRYYIMDTNGASGTPRIATCIPSARPWTKCSGNSAITRLWSKAWIQTRSCSVQKNGVGRDIFTAATINNTARCITGVLFPIARRTAMKITCHGCSTRFIRAAPRREKDCWMSSHCIFIRKAAKR